MPTPLSGLTVNQAKELQLGYPSAALFDITFTDGTTIHICTAFDGYTTGLLFGGVQYISAVSAQSFAGLQASSNMAVSTFGSLSLELADADGTWFGFEKAHGFLGAFISAWQVFWDPNTLQTTIDHNLIFFGTCDPTTRQGEQLTLTATSNYARSKMIAPPVPIQHDCPWIFPSTYSQRLAAANDPNSVFYNCGYSPDVSGGASSGNLVNGVAATDCAKNPAACKVRGMWLYDSRGNQTSRYGGSQFLPTATWKGRQYTTGNKTQGVNSQNLKKYKQYIPLTYGKTWVNAPIFNVTGDPNSTRFECAFGFGGYNDTQSAPANSDAFWRGCIVLLLVNNLLVPYQKDTSDLLFRWYGMGSGSRNGYFNPQAPYNSKSDPYGSMLTMMVVVYDQLQSSNTAPSCQALVWERPIQHWPSGPLGPVQLGRMDWTAWVLYDMYRYSNPTLYAKIDLQSVCDYANICSQQIAYSKLDGTTGMHRRFGVSLSIEAGASWSTIIEGIKLAGRVDVVPDSDGDGTFVFSPRTTLSTQQPAPMPGSNNNQPIQSYRMTDDPTASPSGAGYVAYDFDDSNVILGSVSILQDTIASTPTTLEANIQDEDDLWTPDTVTIANLDLYNASLNLNRGTIQALGLPNYAQAYMVLKSKQAELSMGNPRGDSLGTMRIAFESSVKATHLGIGNIIRFKNTQLGIGPQLLRVEGCAPSQDFFDTKIIGRWHDDRWYTDVFGGSQQGFINTTNVYASVSESYTPALGGQYSVTWNVYNASGHTITLRLGPGTVASGISGSYTATAVAVAAAGEPHGYNSIWTLTDDTTSTLLYGNNQASGYPIVAPGQAAGVIATGSTRNSIFVSWNALLLTTAYSVYVSVVPGFTPTTGTLFTTTGALSAVVDNLLPGTAYYFLVIGNNSGGSGPASAQATAITLP